MGNQMLNPVNSKADFYPRFIANEFGNRGPIWETAEHWLDDLTLDMSDEEFLVAADKLYHLRSNTAGGATVYNLAASQVIPTILKLGKQYPAEKFRVAEMAPHEHNLIQGEVCRSLTGLSLFYSLSPDVPMREALAKGGQTATGLSALMLLQYYVCPESYEWINYLLDSYPGHVVEFSTFSRDWGTIKNRNTVIWEVRNY